MQICRGGVGIAAVLAVAALLPASAPAAYPGANGRIVYATANGLSTMNPDGTGQTQLTSGVALYPSWSPDGTRIAFVRQHTPSPCSPCMRAVHVINADGTGDTPVTAQMQNELELPTWSSDGERIAFTVRAGGQNDIWAVDADGSDLMQVTATADDEVHASWSPDGLRIAFGVQGDILSVRPDGTDRRLLMSGSEDFWLYSPDWSPDGRSLALVGLYLCDGDTCQDVITRRVDGSGGTLVIGGNGDFSARFGQPSWSPDGTRIALGGGGSFFTIAPNGSDRVNTGVAAAQPDWQPLPANTDLGAAPHPLGATPFRVSLVPAAKPCTAPNREHGPPLAYGSCAPVQPESPNLTVSQGDARLRSVGFVRMDVVAGVPGPPDDSDIGIRFSLTNVMNSSDFSDYTGELLASVNVRRTDREPGPVSSTTQDFPFTMPVPCASTTDTFLGSTCAVNTTATAIVPSVVKDGDRTVWAFDALRVFDGGPDGDAHTQGDNSLFATQGVFVP